MRMFKIIVVSLILAIAIAFATMNQWYAKNIRVTFNTDNTKDIEYQIFYTDTSNNDKNIDTNFKGKSSVKKLVPAGNNQINVVLPIEKVVHFRLDFGTNPGTVYISDLKLVGAEIVSLDDFSKFIYNGHIEDHSVVDNNTLRIISNKADPYMFYSEKLDVTPGIDINYQNLIFIALGTFFVVLFLGLFLTRKKAEKQENETNKQSKVKK